MIPKEFWERFKNEKIAVNCQTEDEANDFFKQFMIRGNKCTDLSSTDGIYFYNENDFTKYKYLYKVIPYSEINKSIKEENKVQIKPNEYTYRGQAFSDVEEYAKYILKCKEEDRVKAEKERQDKLKAEELKRENEVIKAYNEYTKTCNEAKEKYEKIAEQYEKDYGKFTINPYPSLNELFNGLDRAFKL